MNIYTYLKNETSEKVLEVVSSQMDLDDHAERTWFNPYTGAILSNYDYIRMIVKTVLVSSNKATLKDDIQVANKIVEYFNRQQENILYRNARRKSMDQRKPYVRFDADRR